MGDRRAVVVKLIKANPEVFAQPEHHLGDHGSAIGREEPIESTPNAVVSQTCELFWIQAQQLRREIGGGLLDAIDRLTLDQQGPQQQPKDSGVGDRQWSRAYGHAALQDRGQTEPVNEVIDEGKGAEPLSQQR